MSGNFDSEQWQNFNQRLSYWISKQGFWFHLRHSLPRAGRKGAFMYHFFHLLFRFVLFLIAAAVCWVGIVKLTGDEKYAKNMDEVFLKKFAAEEIEIRGVRRERGMLSVSRLAMIADQSSFFTGLELSNLSCPRDFFVDLGKTWNPGIVEISKVNLSLRAGADTEEGAGAISRVLFQDLGKLKPDVIQVANMSMNWGYTQHSRGSISKSQMKAVPLADGWRLTFKDGTFTQNWLKSLQIDELDVVISSKGIRFDKASFSKNGGTVELKQFQISAGPRPVVSGQMIMKGMNIASMLPMVARPYVDGKISGNFEVSGSTNSTNGIQFEGIVSLEDGDVITLKDRLHLLRALSVVDASHNYRRVDFLIGSFKLKIAGEGLLLSDVNLLADELMSVTGGMLIRKPKDNEEVVLDDGSEFFADYVTGDEAVEDIDVSLRGANRNLIGFESDADKSLFGRLAVLQENRRLGEYEEAMLSRSYRYEGEFVATLMKTAFDRAPSLKMAYPPILDGGRIPITVPVKGLLYEVTEDFSNQIYEKGRRK